MNTSRRTLAFLAYLLCVIGWLLVLLTGRRDRFAAFHARQSLALFLFILAVTAGWAVFAWLTAWVPYLVILGMGSFSLVIVAYIFGFIAWIKGMSNALRNRMAPLPLVGGWAKRLPPG